MYNCPYIFYFYTSWIFLNIFRTVSPSMKEIQERACKCGYTYLATQADSELCSSASMFLVLRLKVIFTLILNIFQVDVEK